MILELEDPVKSPLQLPETLNQEDLAFRVFLMQTAERPISQDSFVTLSPSLPPAHFSLTH
jgi:hypothetical protein